MNTDDCGKRCSFKRKLKSTEYRAPGWLSPLNVRLWIPAEFFISRYEFKP